MEIFEITWQCMGFVNFTRHDYQNLDFMRKVIDFHTEFYLKCLDAIMQSNVKVVM